MAVTDVYINKNHVVVGDILEDTIVLSTKTQTTSDSELSWLRNRLEVKRHAVASTCAAGKRALESADNASSKHKRVPAGKENTLVPSSAGAAAGVTKVCGSSCVCSCCENVWVLFPR